MADFGKVEDAKALRYPLLVDCVLSHRHVPGVRLVKVEAQPLGYLVLVAVAS